MERYICGICESFKNQKIVFWDTRNGTLEDCEYIVIGEAPGASEDELGLPFVGRSGKLLRRMLAEINITSYYVTNIVKCRPENNRKPTQAEILNCTENYLNKELKYSWEVNKNLKAVIAVGKVASDFLLGKNTYKIYEPSELDSYFNLFVLPIYHPSYILRRMSMYDNWKIMIKKGIENIKQLKKNVCNTL
jgi:DNA polymerase